MQLATKIAKHDQEPCISYQYLRPAIFLTALFSSGMSPKVPMLKTWSPSDTRKMVGTLGGRPVTYLLITEGVCTLKGSCRVLVHPEH